MASIFIPAPTGGIQRQTGFQQTPNLSSIESVNFWPIDYISGRRVSATRPPMAAFASPGTNVNLLAPVSGDATQTPQETMIAASNGTLYYYNSTSSWSAITSASTITTGRQIFAWPYLKRVPIMNTTTSLIFNYADLTLVPWTATVGTLPADCRIVVAWAGGVWITGDPVTPHVVSGSRTGNIFDWDFAASATDTAGAFQFTGENEGMVGEPVTALVPFSSDTMLIASADGLWALRGHPRRGGILEKISDKIGILGQGAWTKGPNGELFFMSRMGVATMQPGGNSVPTLLSEKVVPSELVGLPHSYLDPKINLEYDVRWNGVHVTVRGAEAQAWWLDLSGDGGFHEMTFAEYPVTIARFDSQETEAASGVLYGRDDGIFRFDADGAESIAYKLVTNPTPIAESLSTRSVVSKATVLLHSDTTENVDSYVTLHGGANGDDAYDRYVNEIPTLAYTVTVPSLLSSFGRCYPKITGNSVIMELAGTSAGSRIVFEGAELELGRPVRNPLPVGRTVFDPLTSNLVIGPGWDGGVAAVGTPTAAAAGTLSDFILSVDLSELPAEWWAAVRSDGADIRVTTSNDALRPHDLISFDHAAQTGFLTTRFDLANGVAYTVKVWAGNPTASAPSVSSLFGRYNVYASDVIGYWPTGGGQDRSRNRRDFVSVDGVVFGGVSGPQTYVAGTRYEYGGDDLAPRYQFSTTTTDSDPGNGMLRLDTATQSSVTVLRVDLVDYDGVTQTTDLDAADDTFRLVKDGDITKYIRCDHVSTATPAGYRNITVGSVTASSANPFVNGDILKLCIERESSTDHLRPNAQHIAVNPFTVNDFTLVFNQNFQDTDQSSGTGVGIGPGVWKSGSATEFMYGFPYIEITGGTAVTQFCASEGVPVLDEAFAGYSDLESYFHFAAVRDAPTSGVAAYTLYKNGTSVDTGTGLDSTPSFQADEIRIGSTAAALVSPSESQVTQDISLLHMYNTAKTAAFVAYNHSMTNQATFWASWTMA